MRCLDQLIDSLPVISTHEHHCPFSTGGDVTLEYLFASSYVSWCGVSCAEKGNRGRFLDLVSANSYFVWYEKALDDLFGFGGRITEDNWDTISEKIRAATADVRFHERVFSEKLNCSRAILDVPNDPGSDNGRPDLYAPAFRTGSFLFGSHPGCRDHNGNNAQVLYGECGDLDAYLAMTDRIIAQKKAAGSVCLKLAVGSRRALDFQAVTTQEAEAIFGVHPDDLAPDDIRKFGNFMFDHICGLAAKYGLPIQVHRGLGKPEVAHPMNLVPMIEKHPDTRFVIFHGGYPWIEEVCLLSHNYTNVYVDMCWLPQGCTSAAERFLHSLIEAARNSSRITWGGDCSTVFESYGALLAMRYVLKKVLSEKIASGYLTEDRAQRLAERILSLNARELYGIV